VAVLRVSDRADGELGGSATYERRRHRYDYYSDTAVNAAFFVSIGVGSTSFLARILAIPARLISGASMFLCCLFVDGWSTQPNRKPRLFRQMGF